MSPIPTEEGRRAAEDELRKIGLEPDTGGPARGWSEFIATLADHTPLGYAGLILGALLVATAVTVALLWRPKRGPKKAKVPDVPELEAVSDAELPDLAADQLDGLADQWAAAGRHAEAVRERLRAIVRRLVDAEVIEHHPGWTVTELAAAAGEALPPVSAPLSRAGLIFSDIWYGKRPANAEHDRQMRALATEIGTSIPVGSAR